MGKLEEHTALMIELHRALLRNEFDKCTRDTLAALIEGLCNLQSDEEVDILTHLMKVR